MIKNYKLDRETMRRANLALVLRLFKEHGPLSKTNLSNLTKLTIPAITDLITELESYHLVTPLGETPTKRGRFPVMYEINYDALYIIGIAIGSASIKMTVINLGGKIKYEQTIPLPNPKDKDTVLEQVQFLVNNIFTTADIDTKKIIGIGVGMHGVVDPVYGIAVYPPHLEWKNVDIKKRLENKLSLPVLVDNDCNTLTLAERWFGDCLNINSFIVVNVDYGIGAGIMTDGKLFHGTNFGGGQIGHITVDNDGPKCSCGNYGCLESVASEQAILKNISKKLKQGFNSQLSEYVQDNLDSLTLAHVYEAAINGDQLAKQAFEEAGRYLGIGIATLVNLFNPQKIVITGKIRKGKNLVMKPLTDTVLKTALNTNTQKLEIKTSQLGDYADAIGAATLWIDDLFNGRLKFAELFSSIS